MLGDAQDWGKEKMEKNEPRLKQPFSQQRPDTLLQTALI